MVKKNKIIKIYITVTTAYNYHTDYEKYMFNIYTLQAIYRVEYRLFNTDLTIWLNKNYKTCIKEDIVFTNTLHLLHTHIYISYVLKINKEK